MDTIQMIKMDAKRINAQPNKEEVKANFTIMRDRSMEIHDIPSAVYYQMVLDRLN